METQILSLPKDVKFCRLCVVSNQRPRIQFDYWDVCSACRYAYYKNHIIDWKSRFDELTQFLHGVRKSGHGNLDVIVPSCGGKDSARVAHDLRENWNMNPLTVTWFPFDSTAVGWKNFKGLVDSGFPNLVGHPDGRGLGID